MPRLTLKNPIYRKHKASGQAVVTIAGTDMYLGPYGTNSSKREYDRLIGEWLACGRHAAGRKNDALTVQEVMLRYWNYAKGYYVRPDGLPTEELGCIKIAFKPLRHLYGITPAAEFGPLALKVVRDAIVKTGVSRKNVNGSVGRIKRMFKWAVAEELVPPSVHHGLSAVAGLKKGRTEAPDHEPIKPVPDDILEATLPHLSTTIRAMVELQLLTGARPGEICGLRAESIDQSDPQLWLARLGVHKTAHHGHDRTLYFGFKCQEILRPFLEIRSTGYVFSPARAEAESRAIRSANRKTPLGYGNRPGTNRKRKPKWAPGEHYETDAYRKAITRACDAAFKMPEELREPRIRKGRLEDTKLAKEARLEARSEWRKQHEIHSTAMPGWYYLCIPDAALASGKWVQVILHSANPALNMIDGEAFVKLTATDDQDVTNFGLSNLSEIGTNVAGIKNRIYKLLGLQR